MKREKKAAIPSWRSKRPSSKSADKPKSGSCMVGLNLNGSLRKRLPASAFPDWADEYFCDDCGRDVTKKFNGHQSHSWRPMGAERFICSCGRRWLTGATEWDRLGSLERGKRVGAAVFANVLFCFLACLIALFVYFLTSQPSAALTAGVITYSLFLLLQIRSWFGIVASICRTRFRRGPTSEEN